MQHTPSSFTSVDGPEGYTLIANPTYLLDSLSNNDVTFFIPPYQRNYEWDTDTCKVLLEDALKVAAENAGGIRTEHFFGSIVYVIETSGFGIPAKYVLTDGQQRITSTMLLLMALRDSLEDPRYKSAIQERYIENARAISGGGDDTDYKVKLKQVESDWEAYKLLALKHDVPADFRNSIVYRNYLLFLKEINSLDEEKKRDLLERGLTKFSIISIQLEPDKNKWENPQEIFESMNSLGKPLSLADLVRNYLLMGKSSKAQTKLYNEYWLTLERRLPGKLSEFVRDWMQSDQHRSYKVARENNYKELYGSFKEVVRGRSVEDLFADFVRYSEPYAMACGLESTGNAELDQLIQDIDVIGVATLYSYMTEILAVWRAGGLSTKDAADVLEALRTYILRRRILGMSGAENKFYPTLGGMIQQLIESDGVTMELFSQLSSAEYALRLPNDDELSSRLGTMNFYNLGRSGNYPRLLLSLAEEWLTKSRPAWDDSKLQLEHIMPQTLTVEWREELGASAEEDHRELLNNIGNITLIRHNQELGNSGFSKKKELYAGKSGLQVSQNRVTDQETWNASSIELRREYLVDLLIEGVLSLPSKFRRTSNWKQIDNGSAQFDQKLILNQLIGETINFVDNPMITAKVISDSQVEFEGEKWRLSPLTRELKERAGAVSESGSYQGANYWMWDGVRLNALDL